VLAWCAAVLVSGTVATLRLEVKNPHSAWQTRRPSPEAELWRFTRSQFAEAGLVLVGVQVPSSSPALDALEPFEDWLAEQPEVASVLGPTVVKRIEHVVFMAQGVPRELLDLATAIYSPRHHFLLLYVTLRPLPASGSLDVQVALLERIRAEAPTMLPAGSSLHLAGKVVADVDLNTLLRRDAMKAGPLALLAMALVLGAQLRRRIFGPVLGVAAAAIAVAGWLAVTGTPVSTGTVVCFPITIIVGLAYGIHMEAAIARTGSKATAAREIGVPLRLALFTTVVALLSFVLSPIPALRSYAVASSAGVALGYLAAATLVPHLTGGAGTSSVRRSTWRRAPLRLFRLAARRPLWTAGFWLAVAVVGIVGATRVRIEPNNYLGFFPSQHPTMIAHRTLDRVMGGSLPMYVIAEAEDDTYRNPLVEARLRGYAAAVREAGGVGPVFTPSTASWPIGRGIESWFQGSDSSYTRAVFSVPLLSTAESRRLIAHLDSLAFAHSDSAVQLQVTGPLPAGLPLLQSLVESQVKSLVVLLAVVAVAFVVVTRSWRRGLLLFIPNLVAPLAVAAAMGYGGIALDFTTVVIISLVLGVSVDDTLQLAWAGAARAPGDLRFRAARAVRRIGAPVSVTSLAALVGFGSLALSSFPATARLGTLTGLAVIVAWLADITLAPLLLAGRSRRR
jgi:predicted RND superfamily exporter protein